MKYLPRKSQLSSLLLLALTAANCAPALAGGYGDNSSLPLVDRVVEWIGFRDMTGDRRDLLMFCLAAWGFTFGAFSHIAFKDRGLGVIGNALVGIAGACVGLYLSGPRFGLARHLTEDAHFKASLIICAACSGLALLILSIVKGLTFRLIGGAVDRFDRPARPKPMEVETPAPRFGSGRRRM
jgi:uncharacterized membrane protein YeaQ/YmgE (transglycosylase-associated protein family)